MRNLAIHMRITGLNVTNEDVNTRQLAVNELVDKWGKIPTVGEIVAKAAQIAEALGGDGEPDTSLGKEVEQAIQNHASAFLYTEKPLEVGICSGVAIIEVLSNPNSSNDFGWKIADFYASALWSALSFQAPLLEPKREALRTEVLELARSRTIDTAEKSRLRSKVPDFGELILVMEEAESEENPEISSNFKNATKATIEALRRNAALDREELDFLWWVQLDRSRLLDRQYVRIEEPVRLIAAGIEAAGLLRRPPCDVHRELVLRMLDMNPSLDAAEVIKAAGDDLESLGCEYRSGLVAEAPIVFPLLHALATGRVDIPGAELKRESSEWGLRALLEVGLVKMSVGPISL